MYIYLNDHPPPHVHVKRYDAELRVYLDPWGVVEHAYGSMSAMDERRAIRLVAKYRSTLLKPVETVARMKTTKRRNFPRAKPAPTNARTATSARYDPETERIVFELDNGAAVAIPRAAIRGLADVDSALVANFVLEEYGLGIEWPDLDVSFSIPEMLPELALERRV